MHFALWSAVLTTTLLSQAAFADYGEGFIAYHCVMNKQFEMERLIIWNEELDALQPEIANGKGIIKQKDTLLFNVRIRKPTIESTCKVANSNIKIRIGNLNTESDGYTITLFEKGKPIAYLITDNAGMFWNDEFKIRFTKKNKWEFFCGDARTSTWEQLPPEPRDDSCSYEYSSSETTPGCFAVRPPSSPTPPPLNGRGHR